MIVAVTVVRVVQVAVDEVVDVIAVRDRFVPAAGPVDVRAVVARALVLRGALDRVGLADGQAVLVDVLAVRMMQMPVVQEVDVTVVLDGGVATVGPVGVIVSFVDLTIGHGVGPWFRLSRSV